MIAEAGGSAHLFGASSGGALALEAAAAGSAIDTIAVWEVPYAVGDDIRPRFEEYIADTRRAFDAGRDEEVLELFMRLSGASDDNIADRKAAGKQTSHWADSVALAPTLVHDSVFHNRYQLPTDRLATVTQPVLVTTGGPITVPYMAGLPSDFFDRAADELGSAIRPAGTRWRQRHKACRRLPGRVHSCVRLCSRASTSGSWRDISKTSVR
ncbi:hypothetical protein OHS18_13150 [Amycolatopsis sp. NBC_00355]|uniref:hypothetical protein n=1 Tax=Amycolatopsis sp. NBC_00355 TaxID=2975957 RepID=UPI002E27431F